jgi:hypothetical protein
MRTIKLLLLTAFLAGISQIAAGQNPSLFTTSIDAEASITLGIDLRISKLTDLLFGNIVSNTAGGSVVLDASSGNLSNVSGTFQFMGTSTAASFQIIGMPGQSFVIAAGSFPSQITLTDEGGNTMTVNNFQFLPSGGQIGPDGTAILKLGGTLNIGSNQPGGNYTNTSQLTVTIAYQ